MKRFFFLLWLGLALPGHAEPVIDLSQPVSGSLAPDRLYWSFDDGPENGVFSGCVVDHSPSRYHGRLYSGALNPEPTYTQGRFGLALFLEGAAMPYEDEKGIVRSRSNPKVVWRLGDTPEAWEQDRLDLNGVSFTAGLWVRMERIREGALQSILLFNRGQPQEPGRWGFYLAKDTGDRWTLRFNRLGATEKTDRFNDGAWHHVAVGVNAEAGEVVFWIDGEPFGAPVPMPEPIPAVEDPVRGGILSVGEHLIGAIDDLFVTSGLYRFNPPSSQP